MHGWVSNIAKHLWTHDPDPYNFRNYPQISCLPQPIHNQNKTSKTTKTGCRLQLCDPCFKPHMPCCLDKSGFTVFWFPAAIGNMQFSRHGRWALANLDATSAYLFNLCKSLWTFRIPKNGIHMLLRACPTPPEMLLSSPHLTTPTRKGLGTKLRREGKHLATSGVCLLCNGVMKIYTPCNYWHPGVPVFTWFYIGILSWSKEPFLDCKQWECYEDTYSTDGTVSCQNMSGNSIQKQEGSTDCAVFITL